MSCFGSVIVVLFVDGCFFESSFETKRYHIQSSHLVSSHLMSVRFVSFHFGSRIDMKCPLGKTGRHGTKRTLSGKEGMCFVYKFLLLSKKFYLIVVRFCSSFRGSDNILLLLHSLLVILGYGFNRLSLNCLFSQLLFRVFTSN